MQHQISRISLIGSQYNEIKIIEFLSSILKVLIRKITSALSKSFNSNLDDKIILVELIAFKSILRINISSTFK